MRNPKVVEMENTLKDKQLISGAIVKAGYNPAVPDVMDAAMQVAHDAVLSYNPDKGMALASWVFQNIVWNVKHTFKKDKASAFSLDVDDTVGEEKQSLHEKVAAKGDVEAEAVDAEYVNSIISKLDERGKFVVSFLLKNGNRCGQALGDALATSGLVNMTSVAGRRSYAQALTKKYLGKVKGILAEMQE